ncbi:MAG: cytochrome C oxidase subunit IV family protein [Gammaproteobacteria bacterium]|jgi:caa(3)-type oxidase subunit IV|nr:cytochrome C oxidase subunit IV family protein [Gammaproteobacteria bacterium]MBT3489999.1 cytochrome C oxidase subunit IV family protein [Gammaproteobacteria bacterium]MBT3717458.1 cytochrome C oxidase subunit IV family protein [Gammaproteobacteria bacterium]MBT3844316.1 cytochrome C oxidase subunit IV family protein [Gammaproteobacteria bacterium]MBT3893730.1 cytochrome C oxidase subunit IV family protein [Gammaproteobacteria bacterium]
MSESVSAAIVWVVLVALTLMGYWVGQNGLSGTDAVTILLGAALIKGQLVIGYFMEMRHAKTRWRYVPTIWLTLVLLVMAFNY